MTKDARAPTKSALKKRLILDAAIDAFSEQNRAAVRVEDIAQRAGVNKSLIYYYFDSKESLYDAVMEDLVEAGFDFMAPTPTATLSEWMDHVLRWSREHPRDPQTRVWALEGMSDTGEVVRERERTRSLLESTRVVIRAQARGEVDPELDPEMITLMMISMFVTPQILRQATRMTTGLDSEDPAFHDRMAKFAQQLVHRLGPAGDASGAAPVVDHDSAR
ncbi:MAG: TetR/AcrR family transcriptional regulator [Mycetocola sp.]